MVPRHFAYNSFCRGLRHIAPPFFFPRCGGLGRIFGGPGVCLGVVRSLPFASTHLFRPSSALPHVMLLGALQGLSNATTLLLLRRPSTLSLPCPTASPLGVRFFGQTRDIAHQLAATTHKLSGSCGVGGRVLLQFRHAVSTRAIRHDSNNAQVKDPDIRYGAPPRAPECLFSEVGFPGSAHSIPALQILAAIALDVPTQCRQALAFWQLFPAKHIRMLCWQSQRGFALVLALHWRPCAVGHSQF